MKQKLIPLIDEKTGQRRDYYFIDPASGIVWFKKDHNCKRIKFSCHVTQDQFKKAQIFANNKFDIMIGKKKAVKVHSLIKDELEIWEALKQGEGLKPDTNKNVRNARKQIEPFWGEMFPYQIHRENLAQWYVWFKQEYPGQQMENAIKYMRNFCRFLSEKVVDDKPLLPAIPKIRDPDFKKVRRARRRRKERVFTLDEVRDVLKICDPQERIIILFMYTMALRITQTLELKWEQLDLVNETYTFRDGDNKADLEGVQDIHSSLVPLLKKRRKSIVGEWLFPQMYKSQPLKEQQIDWIGLRKRANLGWHWSAHTFRHTCLTNLFNDERCPQALICKLYRVSLATAMETYIKVTPEGRKKMKNAIKVKV